MCRENMTVSITRLSSSRADIACEVACSHQRIGFSMSVAQRDLTDCAQLHLDRQKLQQRKKPGVSKFRIAKRCLSCQMRLHCHPSCQQGVSLVVQMIFFPFMVTQ